ncbi:MAG: ATP-binding cassette domain-containing protein [Tenuifilum sp.]|uniref:ABC transporter ATP-binding protein n=1 Tax=Tenuifilum sp. TaxID=2760880 RepID=UPI00309848AA
MLVVDQISKHFKLFSLREITFKVSQGDYFMLLGPSGSGKSLLLQIIAGLVKPDSGRILFNGIDITKSPAGKRNVGILFQDLALFPHLSVFDNIAYPLKLRKHSSFAVKQRVVELAEQFSISHILNQGVTSLSGGEKQRVALARTLAFNPPILLLDEPLSAIDSQLHLDLGVLLRSINRAGTTIIHVTHNYQEAISLASKVGVLHNGQLVQVGEPVEVFQNPRSEFVANFTGAKNFYRVKGVRATPDGLIYAELPLGEIIAFYANPVYSNGFICFPEESVVLSTQAENQSAINVFSGRVIDIFAQRFGYEVVIDCGFKVFALITKESLEKLKISPGIKLYAAVKANAVRFIPEI